VMSSCIALYCGGYVAAWMAGCEIKFNGGLHGLVTWGVATLVTIYLLSSAIGGIVGGGFSAIGGVASSIGGGVKEAAAPIANAVGISPEMLQEQATAYMAPTNPDPATMNAPDAQKEVASNLATFAMGGADAPAAKERVMDIMAAQMKISRADATQKFNAAQTKARQAVDATKQKAKDAADASASAASKTAFAAFIDLLLGALAAAWGGNMAINRRRVHVAQDNRTAL
jgi:hypothetical protein